ncbi:NUDIX hydrolase [Deltaproteobacteria bacterium OttesenSCG-928-K17]|nr:NUDIX hydrolase [Deltaproteobacteria bacterium OttesenSCG-928-K17]
MNKYCYEFPRPAITVDAVVFGLNETKLEVLLIKRGLAPYKGKWALPGGFVRLDEALEDAVKRELAEETGLENIYLEQLATFGDPRRDPRGHTLSVAYFALVNRREYAAQGAGDAAEARWFDVQALPALAFDHAAIIAAAIERLRGKLRYKPIGFELLPELFPLRSLQQLYETVLGRSLDKRNFRKKILSMGILRETSETETGASRKPARLYAFDRWAYDYMIKKGVNFEI